MWNQHNYQDIPPFWTTREIATWNELYDFFRQQLSYSQKDWICRGQGGDWALETTLERACKSFRLNLGGTSDTEKKLIREFRRRYHFYSSHIPLPDDKLEWLALMQHYGAPTRLLDWTYSFFVAVFFAFEKRSTNDKYVVWCIDNQWLLDNQWNKLRQSNIPNVDRLINDFGANRSPQTSNKLFFGSPRQMVCCVNPFRYNERMTIQQGVFLCPCDLSQTFMENLRYLRNAPNNAEQHIYKLILYDNQNSDFRKEALRQLNRMNMNRATLFPGLDGFAQSLVTRLFQLDEIDIATRKLP